MPLFVYNRNIPDGPNNPSVDQPDMETNTNSTDDLIDIDHFSFNDANGGLHRQVNMINQTAPNPVRLGDSVIYSRTSGGASVPWLKNALYDVPLVTGSPNFNANGGTSIFGGAIINWGFVDGTHGGVPHRFRNTDQGTVNFTIPYTGFCFGVQTTVLYNFDPPISNPPAVVIRENSVNLTSFAWTFLVDESGNSLFSRFYWWAIGF